jgi:hypothetical protein
MCKSEIFHQFEFLRQLSSNSKDTVIGLVRDKAATKSRVAKELDGRPNIHIVESDVTDYDGLKVLLSSTEPLLAFRPANANKNVLFKEGCRRNLKNHWRPP